MYIYIYIYIYVYPCKEPYTLRPLSPVSAVNPSEGRWPVARIVSEALPNTAQIGEFNAKNLGMALWALSRAKSTFI